MHVKMNVERFLLNFEFLFRLNWVILALWIFGLLAYFGLIHIFALESEQETIIKSHVCMVDNKVTKEINDDNRIKVSLQCGEDNYKTDSVDNILYALQNSKELHCDLTEGSLTKRIRLRCKGDN